MKTLLLAALLSLLPDLILAQINIVLPMSQNPALGFSIPKTDTTIVKGGSATLGNGITISGGAGGYGYLWSPAASLNNPTLLNPRATPSDTTEYLLTITDKNGCSITLKYKVNVKLATAADELVFSRGSLRVTLFPNPVTRELMVHLRGVPEERIDLLIINSEGKLLNRQIIRNFDGDHTHEIRLDPGSGVYTLRVISAKTTLSHLFVIR